MSSKWNNEARDVLKSILKRKNVGYDKLADLLNSTGSKETSGSINSKINRGTFSFAFFINCMNVLEINKIDLNIGEQG